MTALSRTSRNLKGESRSLVREDDPHQQTRNCPTVLKFGRKPQMGALFLDRLGD
jgi:hypothetical protein